MHPPFLAIGRQGMDLEIMGQLDQAIKKCPVRATVIWFKNHNLRHDLTWPCFIWPRLRSSVP